MIYNVQINNGNRSSLINYINKNKIYEKFTVIDIGGTMGGWSEPYIDALVDFNEQKEDPILEKLEESEKETKKRKPLFFNCDITHPNSWTPILEYVKENGKFDFCICTHTLEDIMNPGFVCEQICKIAKEGYIAFPSKYRELCRNMDNQMHNYRGYIHHRWIFTVKKEENIKNEEENQEENQCKIQKLVAFPKINYLDSEIKFDQIANPDNDCCDLNFFWKENIELEYLNNNFLGPNVAAVLKYYDKLLESEYV
jgi:hypothetical protein